MQGREIPGWGHDSKTKIKILDEALKLFAVRGYNAVSVMDICKVLGIQKTTLYYHFSNKEALFEEIMMRFEESYRLYFDWLRSVNMEVETLEELMDNIFNQEVLDMSNIIGCLGMSLTVKEQHDIESARKRAFELFYEHSIESMKADFDRLIEKGAIPPADTKAIAMILMNNIIVINDMRIHELIGAVSSVNSMGMYSGLKEFLTNALKRGSTET